jgi:hypothetical protein
MPIPLFTKMRDQNRHPLYRLGAVIVRLGILQIESGMVSGLAAPPPGGFWVKM